MSDLVARIQRYVGQFDDGMGNNQPAAAELLREAAIELTDLESTLQAYRAGVQQVVDHGVRPTISARRFREPDTQWFVLVPIEDFNTLAALCATETRWDGTQ